MECERKRVEVQQASVPVATSPSLTIDEFCAVERISRTFYYKLEKSGIGPRTMKVGACRRISPEAHAEWRRAREAAAA